MLRNFLGPVLGQSGRTELRNRKFSYCSTFLKSHIITKWSLDLQLGPRIYSKARGYLSGGLPRKYIFKITPRKNMFLETEAPLFLVKGAISVMSFSGFCFPPPPPPPPPHSTPSHSDSHPCIRLYDGPAILRRACQTDAGR